jgi:S1-C subfamily serine protease
MPPISSPRRYGLPALVVLLALAVVIALQLLGGAAREESDAALPSPAPAPAGFEDVVAKALPSVVLIRTEKGLGSGVVFDRAGHVVTNAHVVEDFRRFRVTLADGSEHAATLRGTFREGDLAVVRLAGARPQPATFADSSKVKVGQYALAIGNPLGLQSSVTQGIVSSTSRTIPESAEVSLPSVIQTSAPINPGNSGGALVDATGAVIGIPTLAATDPQLGGGAADGIGFAISSNTVRTIATQIIATGRVEHSGRAWLGVDLRTVSGVGVVVASATPSGPAARAGVQPGDVITRLAGRSAATVDDIAGALATERPGQRIELQLRGPNGSRSAAVTLGELPPR